jgi:hypothetical protein
MIYQTQGKHTNMIYQTQGKHTDWANSCFSIIIFML